ncbi:MAG: stalk domain-containing protein [Defluviitaleaceae bacterium]|nr:stalk domain-containing protein [Defluviitaleaceae bacterium]
MQYFMISLLTASVVMSAIALIYMVCTSFLAKRYSEKGFYYTWLVIVFGLIMPFRPRWNISPVFQMQVNNETLPFAQTIEHAAVYPAATSVSWWQIAAAVWFVGVVIFLLCHALKHYRFVKTTERWSEVITDEQILSLLNNLKKEMKITRRIEIYVCSSAGSPMLIGLFRPRIFLPTVETAHDELRFILKHELVHYKRKDLLYKCIVLVATAMHWFNPVVYPVANEIANLCEMSCDAEVVKNADDDVRQLYIEAIIGVVKYKSKLKTALSTSYYGGKNSMKKRIASIMGITGKRMSIAGACMTVFITFGAGLIFGVIPTQIFEDDGTLMPLRTISEELGAQVDFDAPTQTITIVKDDIIVTMQVGSNILFRNGEQITMDVPPQIADGRVMLPIRSITESFGTEPD